MPTLRDGELHVWESHTILRYVANKQEAHALYPRDPAARSQVERWMDWTLASLNVAYLAGFKEAKLPPEQLSEAAANCCPPSCRCWTGTWRAGPGSRARPSPWPTSAWRRWCAAA